MTEKELWSLYQKENPREERNYDAWSFGLNKEQADYLSKLVLDGTKTATASSYQLYEIEKIQLPPVGGLNIILDSKGQGICITETTKVYTCPFSQVSEKHAYLEGEGDRSLNYWKEVHEEFFSEELEGYGLTFDQDMLVVCEEFRIIFGRKKEGYN